MSAESPQEVICRGINNSNIFLAEEGKWFEVNGINCCNGEITSSQLKEFFSGASEDKINALKDAFNNSFVKFSINTCLRKAHFFAQIREEVAANIKTFSESLNFFVEALKSTFSYFSETLMKQNYMEDQINTRQIPQPRLVTPVASLSRKAGL